MGLAAMRVACMVVLGQCAACCGSPPRAPVTGAEAVPDEWVAARIPATSASLAWLSHPIARDGADQLFVVGPYRFLAHPDGVEVAEDVPRRSLVAHARARDCWLFLVEDGTLARASSFTGALEPIGAVGDGGPVFEPARSPLDSEALVVASEDTLWSARCDGSVERVDVDGVLAGVWVTPELGILVRAPGEILRWRGGRAEPVAALEHRWMGLWRDGERALVTTDVEGLSVGPSGPPTSRPLEPAGERGPESAWGLGDGAIRARMALLLSRAYALHYLDDGTVVTIADDEGWRLDYRRGDGSMGSMPPPPGTDGCSVRASGATLLASCGGERRSGFRWEPGGAWAPLPFAPRIDGMVTDARGGFYEPPPRDGEPGRWFSGEGSPAARRLAGTVRDLDSEVALVRAGAEGQREVLVARLSEGEAPSPSPLGVEGRALDAVFVGHDVFALIARADGALALARGPVGALRVGPAVPPGVTRIEFADARHGLALGPEHVSRRTTGARTGATRSTPPRCGASPSSAPRTRAGSGRSSTRTRSGSPRARLPSSRSCPKHTRPTKATKTRQPRASRRSPRIRGGPAPSTTNGSPRSAGRTRGRCSAITAGSTGWAPTDRSRGRDGTRAARSARGRPRARAPRRAPTAGGASSGSTETA